MQAQPVVAIIGKLLTAAGAVAMFVSLFLDFFDDGKSGWTEFKSQDIVITAVAGLIFVLIQLSLSLPAARAVLAELTIPLAFFALGLFVVDGHALERYDKGGFLGISGAGLACIGAMIAAGGERLLGPRPARAQSEKRTAKAAG